MHNAGWRELYDGFVPDIRLHKLIRKGLLRWWKAELLNLRFLFASSETDSERDGAEARGRGLMSPRDWWRRFAVRSVLWRHYLDFGVTQRPVLPAAGHDLLLDHLFLFLRRAGASGDP